MGCSPNLASLACCFLLGPFCPAKMRSPGLRTGRCWLSTSPRSNSPAKPYTAAWTTLSVSERGKLHGCPAAQRSPDWPALRRSRVLTRLGDWYAAAPCPTGRRALLLLHGSGLPCWERSCLAVHQCHVTYRETMQACPTGRQAACRWSSRAGRQAKAGWQCRGRRCRQLACRDPRDGGGEAGSWVGSGWGAQLKAQPGCRPTTWCSCNLHPGSSSLPTSGVACAAW